VSSGAEDSTPKQALLGRWTYRSLMSNPDIDVEFGDLEFGRGELIVEYVCWGKLIGRLIFGDDYQFRLVGTVNPGDPPTVSFDGYGDATASNGHHYQYFGCVMPLWPHDPRKRPTIVGSVIRAAPKSGSKERAGGASAFIAVKHNDLPEPDAAKPADAAAGAPATSPAPSDGAATGAPAGSSAPAGGASAAPAAGSSAPAAGAAADPAASPPTPPVAPGTVAPGHSASAPGSGAATPGGPPLPPGAHGYESDTESKPPRW